MLYSDKRPQQLIVHQYYRERTNRTVSSITVFRLFWVCTQAICGKHLNTKVSISYFAKLTMTWLEILRNFYTAGALNDSFLCIFDDLVSSNRPRDQNK